MRCQTHVQRFASSTPSTGRAKHFLRHQATHTKAKMALALN